MTADDEGDLKFGDWRFAKPGEKPTGKLYLKLSAGGIRGWWEPVAGPTFDEVKKLEERRCPTD